MKEKDKEAVQELHDFLTELYEIVHENPEPEVVDFQVERNKVLRFKRTLYKFIEYYNTMHNKLQLFVQEVLGADMEQFNKLFDDIVEGNVSREEIEKRLVGMSSSENIQEPEHSVKFIDLTRGPVDELEYQNEVEGFRMLASEQGGLN